MGSLANRMVFRHTAFLSQITLVILDNILKLAPRFENSEELDDVSPFIYVMF